MDRQSRGLKVRVPHLTIDFGMRMDFVLIFFTKPDISKTLKNQLLLKRYRKYASKLRLRKAARRPVISHCLLSSCICSIGFPHYVIVLRESITDHLICTFTSSLALLLREYITAKIVMASAGKLKFKRLK